MKKTLLILFVMIPFCVYAEPPIEDGDGVPYALDNCQTKPNAGQEDDDNDGYGNRCDADLNQTELVNIADFVIFRKCFNDEEAGLTPNPACDFDSNGSVTARDFFIFQRSFGKPPGPSALTPR